MGKKIKKSMIVCSLLSVVFGSTIQENTAAAVNYKTTVSATSVNKSTQGNNLNSKIKTETNVAADTSIYYSQLDTRWRYSRFGKYTFGASGCVPTSLAMGISSVTNKVVSPVEVGKYLYNYTNKFNKSGIGTSGAGIISGALNYGLNVKGLNSVAEIKAALQRGHSVIAAVRGGTVFVKSGSTHAIVLTGYKNGTTFVKDPYNSNNNRWFDINYLYNIRSFDALDKETGYVFHEIY